MCLACNNRNRYQTDEEFRNKVKIHSNKNAKKRYKANKDNPEYMKRLREKQKKYREKHPDKFCLYMAKHYFGKITEEQRQEIIKEYQK